MDFSGRMESIREAADTIRTLLQGQRVVVCFGQRATLLFFLAGHLNSDQVGGAFTSATEAMACIEQQAPDLLICGQHLEQGCGLELAVAVKQRWPSTKTLVLVSPNAHTALLRAAVDAGCDGLLLDSSLGMGAGTGAVLTICRGGLVIDRKIAEQLRPHQGNRNSLALERLSERELDVLTQLAHGCSNAEIAAHLVIAIDTVKSHIKAILLKLNARGRTHAAVLALQLGLVEWPAEMEGR